jgi:hypothetical protein
MRDRRLTVAGIERSTVVQLLRHFVIWNCQERILSWVCWRVWGIYFRCARSTFGLGTRKCDIAKRRIEWIFCVKWSANTGVTDDKATGSEKCRRCCGGMLDDSEAKLKFLLSYRNERRCGVNTGTAHVILVNEFAEYVPVNEPVWRTSCFT